MIFLMYFFCLRWRKNEKKKRKNVRKKREKSEKTPSWKNCAGFQKKLEHPAFRGKLFSVSFSTEKDKKETGARLFFSCLLWFVQISSEKMMKKGKKKKLVGECLGWVFFWLETLEDKTSWTISGKGHIVRILLFCFVFFFSFSPGWVLAKKKIRKIHLSPEIRIPQTLEFKLELAWRRKKMQKEKQMPPSLSPFWWPTLDETNGLDFPSGSLLPIFFFVCFGHFYFTLFWETGSFLIEVGKILIAKKFPRFILRG